MLCLRISPRASRWDHRACKGLAYAAAALLAAAVLDGSSAVAEETSTHALSQATGLPLSGRAYADFYGPVRDFDTNPHRYIGTSLWLQADPKLGEKSSARVVLQSDALDTSPAGSVFRTQLREGYLTFSDAGWEIRAGRQIIPWGKTDAINPTDLISAKDYTVLNPDEEVRRTGQTSILVNFTPMKGNSPVTITGILTAVPAQSRLLFDPAQAPAGVSLAGTPFLPPATVANNETALKAAYVGSGWDASAFVFRGFNHMPEFVFTGPVTLAGAPVGQTFHRIHAVGGDFSFTWDKLIFRGESAYVWTQNNDGTNPTIMPTHWDSVVGVERAFGSDFRLQVQGLWRFIPRFTPADQAGGANPLEIVANRQLAAANALVLNYQDKSRGGATLRFGYTNESSGIDTEVFVLGNFIGGDYLVRPKLSYNVTDALKATVGLDWYGGPDDRPLGQLRVYNSFFTEAKYSF